MQTLSLSVIAVAASIFTACPNPTDVDLVPTGNSPVGSFSLNGASVPIGAVVAFSAAKSDAVVTATIDDTSIATVTPTTQTNILVIVGISSGQTTLHVYANNQETFDIPVQVAAQTVP